jgi:hypothetical protein
MPTRTFDYLEELFRCDHVWRSSFGIASYEENVRCRRLDALFLFSCLSLIGVLVPLLGRAFSWFQTLPTLMRFCFYHQLLDPWYHLFFSHVFVFCPCCAYYYQVGSTGLTCDSLEESACKNNGPGEKFKRHQLLIRWTPVASITGSPTTIFAYPNAASITAST